jgi:hypothetical protein
MLFYQFIVDSLNNLFSIIYPTRFYFTSRLGTRPQHTNLFGSKSIGYCPVKLKNMMVHMTDIVNMKASARA